MTEQGDEQQAQSRQLVIFDLAGESYGIDINVVREIIRQPRLTVVPDMPDYVEGVINLRGRIRPMIDLRKRLGLPVGEATAQTRVLVLDIDDDEVGAVVDAVTEVMAIDASSVQSADSLLAAERIRYIEGIAHVGERLLILLDARCVVGDSAVAA